MASDALYTFEDYMHKVTVKRVAWCGDEYWRMPVDQRLLLVAESYYDRKKNVGRPPSRWFINKVVSEGWKYAYYTKLLRLVVGNPIAGNIGGSARDFWHKVIFYHYIQNSAGNGPRQRPTTEQWAGAAPLFDRIVRESTPSHVIFVGKQLWHAAIAAKMVVQEEVLVGHVPMISPHPRALAVHHPSARGYHYAHEHARVRETLGEKMLGELLKAIIPEVGSPSRQELFRD